MPPRKLYKKKISARYRNTAQRHCSGCSPHIPLAVLSTFDVAIVVVTTPVPVYSIDTIVVAAFLVLSMLLLLLQMFLRESARRRIISMVPTVVVFEYLGIINVVDRPVAIDVLIGVFVLTVGLHRY